MGGFATRQAFRLACALVCALLAFGCGASGDQTEQANHLVDEMNALIARSEDFTRQGAAKDEELTKHDIEQERDTVRTLARQQSDLYRQSGDALREAASKAEEGAQMRIDEWFKNYLTLKARQLRKGVELLDAGRERADVLASDASLEEVDARLSQHEERIVALAKEEEELLKQVQQVEVQHKDDFRRDEPEKK